jgi:hypothetical protein
MATVEPTERIAALDGSTLEYTDIPIHAGTLDIPFDKPFRLPAIREHSHEELGTLLSLTYDLFVTNWQRVRFGPCIEGAVFELELEKEPEIFAMLDGYLTVHLSPGPAHMHLCIGPTEGLGKGSHGGKTPPALAQKRRCSRAAFFTITSAGSCTPGSWGVRLWNGEGLQMITFFLPSPHLNDELKPQRQPDWSRLDLWFALRRRYLGERAEDQVRPQ